MEIEAQMREGLRASFLEGTKSTREAKLPWSAAVSPPEVLGSSCSEHGSGSTHQSKSMFCSTEDSNVCNFLAVET